jgi:hypothetical protein
MWEETKDPSTRRKKLKKVRNERKISGIPESNGVD